MALSQLHIRNNYDEERVATPAGTRGCSISPPRESAKKKIKKCKQTWFPWLPTESLRKIFGFLHGLHCLHLTAETPDFLGRFIKPK
jgi:hypothetical protein